MIGHIGTPPGPPNVYVMCNNSKIINRSQSVRWIPRMPTSGTDSHTVQMITSFFWYRLSHCAHDKIFFQVQTVTLWTVAVLVECLLEWAVRTLSMSWQVSPGSWSVQKSLEFIWPVRFTGFYSRTCFIVLGSLLIVISPNGEITWL